MRELIGEIDLDNGGSSYINEIREILGHCTNYFGLTVNQYGVSVFLFTT